MELFCWAGIDRVGSMLANVESVAAIEGPGYSNGLLTLSSL